MRSVRLFVAEGLADAALLDRAPKRRSRKHDTKRLAAIQAAAAIYAGRGGNIGLVELGARA